MKFKHKLIRGILKKRYKRFLADVEVNGKVMQVHCPNPGAMTGLNTPNSICWISDSHNPKRKLRYTLEIVEIKNPKKILVGINTNNPNKIALEAIKGKKIKQLNGYDTIKTEVKYGENSRIDLLLEAKNKKLCYVEIKNVHLVRTKGIHEFPDSITKRGTKHLGELIQMKKRGCRAVMLYVIQRNDGGRFTIAKDIDPEYYNAFVKAKNDGVEMLALVCEVSTKEITAQKLITVDV